MYIMLKVSGASVWCIGLLKLYVTVYSVKCLYACFLCVVYKRNTSDDVLENF